jgi:DNA-binding transcriptional regulator GbsR (MarR family)
VSPKTNGNNKFYKRAQETVKDFSKKRSAVAKENFNKLVSVSQQDVQELSALFKELDTLHRTQFEEIKKAFQNKKEKSEDDVTATEEVAVTAEVEVVADDENIFADK